MRDTAADGARREEMVAPDHFPSCPSCGDLCGRLALRCAGCGAKLYDDEKAAPTGEDPQATKGTEA